MKTTSRTERASSAAPPVDGRRRPLLGVRAGLLGIALLLATSAAHAQTIELFDQCVDQGAPLERAKLRRAFPAGPQKLVAAMLDSSRELTDEESASLTVYSAVVLDCMEKVAPKDRRDEIRNRVFLLDLLTSRRLQISQYAALVWNQNRLVADAGDRLARGALSNSPTQAPVLDGR
jgi:hypothetical protein